MISIIRPSARITAAPPQEYPHPRYYFRIGNVSVNEVFHYSDTESVRELLFLENKQTAELASVQRALYS